ncbi:MAG: phage tail protein [Deltaproteobacteria bacterium]|nr:phage tail protein [Deltaproteobacteria bacterium]
MANPTANRKDPLPVFCFKVELDLDGFGEPAAAFFKSVSGLRYETEIVPVREGGANNTTFQLVGATKWSNIVLKQGFTGSSLLLKWREAWTNGNMKRIPTGRIIQLDSTLKLAAEWTFFRGWPAKWEMAEFDASKSELAIETLEIAHEGIKFGPA